MPTLAFLPYSITSVHQDTQTCVLFRGAVFSGAKALKEAAVIKSMSAAFLGSVCGEEPHCIYTTTILKSKVAAVSVGIL